jgi:hypothetical protein
LGDPFGGANRARSKRRVAWHRNERDVGPKKSWKLAFGDEFLDMQGHLLE